MSREFKLKRGGIQDKFLASRVKIQIFGGAFGNGKSTAMVMKALQLSQVYPGMNALMARSTYPKLNDTLRKTFLDWCPKEWIKSFPLSVNANNTCTLNNGTTFPFRYIAQQGKNEESSTSNLLSATYDLIVVDQMEDPEITYKDFLDLLGRLRGNTPYRGDDPSMPRTGPRWMLIGVNPTRNWVYTELVKPYHDYMERGIVSDKLLCLRDGNGLPKLDEDGKPILLIEIVEGSTYENAHNLPEDFITTQESTYKGQMRDRFLLGKWAAYEGLVYPQFIENEHCVDPRGISNYLKRLENYNIEWVEAYDYGLASPSCYLLGFTDPTGNIIWVDGYHKKEFVLDGPEGQYATIKKIRTKWGVDSGNIIKADPDIFRRKGAGSIISDLFHTDGGLLVSRAQNDIISGITKVQSYLNLRDEWINPFTLVSPAPSMYFSDDLDFVKVEFAGYFWKKNTQGERIDEPNDYNDHAMDTIKYGLTNKPLASELIPIQIITKPPILRWSEQEMNDYIRSRRHG